jgi:hypothetical protein
LDTRYGAGVVNVFNSWKELRGGKVAPIESTSVLSGMAHPPGNNSANLESLVGWDFRAISNDAAHDQVNHYYINVLAGGMTLTATLVWNRQAGQAAINGLDLFLYNTANGNVVAASLSTVDNVEHIYIPRLPTGRYDLQVVKNGLAKWVTVSESYALAIETFALPLSISKAGANATITWPLSPTGFTLESTASLNPPISWTAVTNPVSIVNNSNQMTVNASSGQRFFRLKR